MAPSRKRMGRPPKPSSQVRAVVYPVRLTRGEWREFQKLAKATGETVSDLMRVGGLQRARRLGHKEPQE